MIPCDEWSIIVSVQQGLGGDVWWCWNVLDHGRSSFMLALGLGLGLGLSHIRLIWVVWGRTVGQTDLSGPNIGCVHKISQSSGSILNITFLACTLTLKTSTISFPRSISCNVQCSNDIRGGFVRWYVMSKMRYILCCVLVVVRCGCTNGKMLWCAFMMWYAIMWW